MIVYRIAAKSRINDLNGRGAEIAGGRWNHKGLPVLYTASTSSLAILEKLVHVELDLFPTSLYFAVIEIKGKFTQKILTAEDLPEKWNQFPNPDVLKEIGRQWLEENKFLVLSVPSAVNTHEVNHLINPRHIEMPKVKIVDTYPFEIDKRLFGN